MKLWLLVVLASVMVAVPNASGARILFINAIGSKSHKGYFTAFISKLANQGHEITIISPYKPSKERKNIREIVLADLDIQGLLPNLFEKNSMAAPMRLMSLAPTVCSDALSRKEVQALYKEKFDLGLISIFMTECFLSMFHQMKIPFAYVNPAGLLGPIGSIVGNPVFPSYVPSPFLNSFYPLTFTERLQNAMVETVGLAVIDRILMPKMDAECRRQGLCPDSVPHLSEVRNNASLLFVNSIKEMESPPRPVLPSVIYVGGIHCQESKPLPKDLEEWVAGAGKDGFIFFSLGSVVQPSSMPEEYRKVLVEALGSLKQRVLWKWNEDTMENLPPNVRLGKWLPQQDILADPRLRVFITHGGALSTQESIYHGTPVIGLPVFADQMSNMVAVQHQGWGRVLKWEELTVQLLKDTIHTVINDQKMRAEVKRRSSLMRDIPQDPGQVANFWVEYILRHEGAHHLRSPTLTMSWCELYNVDVWLTVFVVAVIVVTLLVKLLLSLLRCIFSSKSKTKRD